ncbi:MAG: hypothetical protein WBR15_06380 [Gammaproteobacteria bacterium]
MKFARIAATVSTIGISLILLLVGGGYCASAQASETCHTPAPQTLIHWYNTTHPEKPLRYSQQNSAIYHPISIFKTDSPRLHWIGLAWLSPIWGALFAVNCDGKPLAAVSDGAVGKISAGPVLPAFGQTVMFEYVDHETADCVHDSIGIAAIKDGKIISLWKHGYKQGMTVTGHATAFRGFVSRDYTVTLDTKGQTIRMTGRFLTYPYLKDGSQAATPSVTKTLPMEIYHWDKGKQHYLPENRYHQSASCTIDD